MPSERLISQLQPSDEVSMVFLLKEKNMATSRAGKKFLTLTLADRSGQLDGKLWDDAEAIDPHLERMNPVKVEGVVSVYREKLQITVRTITGLKWSPELYVKLMPASKFERADMEARIKAVVTKLKDRHVRSLVKTIAGDQALWDRFASVPAAKMIHHAYLRGLMEHSVSMMEIGALLADHYEKQFPGLIDRDLVVAGALLHDMGKTAEYEYEQGIDISTQGRLIGHLVLGVEILNRVIADLPGFPEPLAQRIKHMIVSHHGELELGSPIRPITPEAMLLHQVDLLDSQINAMASILSTAGEDEFSQFSQKFERRFLNTRFEPEEATGPRAEAAHAPKGEAEPPRPESPRKEPARAEPPKAEPPQAEPPPRPAAPPAPPPPPPRVEVAPPAPPAPPPPRIDDKGGDTWEKEIPAAPPPAPAPVFQSSLQPSSESGPVDAADDPSGADRTGARKKKHPSKPELF